MDSRVSFPQWLVNEREIRGWTQSELSRAAGISRQVVSDYEGYKRKYFDEEILTKIANAFKVPPDQVFRAAGLLPPKSDIDEETEELNHLVELLTPDKRKIAKSILNALIDGPAQAAPARKPRPTKAKA